MKGHCRESSTTFTNACRMVCDLGGHILPSKLVIQPQHIHIFDEHTRLHIRSLFWLCYSFDKDLAIRMGCHPLLTSAHCDLSGCGEYSNRKTTEYNYSRDTNLAMIKETASRLLCSPHAFRYTESELLAHVRQLDDELEVWRMSIEPRSRPRLSIPPERRPNAKPTGRPAQRRALERGPLYRSESVYLPVPRCRCGFLGRGIRLGRRALCAHGCDAAFF
jgi:hypothetical protein